MREELKRLVKDGTNEGQSKKSPIMMSEKKTLESCDEDFKFVKVYPGVPLSS